MSLKVKSGPPGARAAAARASDNSAVVGAEVSAREAARWQLGSVMTVSSTKDQRLALKKRQKIFEECKSNVKL